MIGWILLGLFVFALIVSVISAEIKIQAEKNEKKD